MIITEGESMKKGQIFEGKIEKVEFPNKGIINIDGEKVIVKNVIEGQKIKGVLIKNKKDKKQGRVLEVLEKSELEKDAPCKDFGQCGGCLYQSISYADQLNLKVRQVKELLDTLEVDYEFEGIDSSPNIFRYRNKMEYSFGDEFKDGPLCLGLHKRNSMHDIVETTQCHLVHEDFNTILKTVLKHFQEENISYYHKKTHEGYLRYLVVRRGEKTNQLIVNIVTSSQMDYDYKKVIDKLLNLNLENNITSIIHTINDSLSDAVKVDDIKILYGKDYFYEEILNLKFKISPFSFFQTNSLGAEKLYSVVREYVGDTEDKVVFDLYSGTGTITQMLAPIAKKAVGVEIVEEAVEAAKENAKLNNLDNCEFIAGDVLKVIDELTDKPDIIVLDPPRSGIHPKALPKIIDFGVDNIVYVSCKPTSLVRDLQVFIENGYRVEKVRCVDMFPHTVHVETIVRIQRKESAK
jgi:23S rRNA (uracil-5-)-methyltransferase RumA